jgi:MHS family proline/betaine transporter-like MFS transporter
MVSIPLPASTPGADVRRRRAISATVLGNTLEWFDFASYAFFAAVISRQFFPQDNPTAALLATYAIFGIGFVARPLGAIFFGRLGDVHGRKLALLIAMPMMGLGTLLIGLMPSYAQIGIAAPILLVACRMMQGFSAGGELGNAITFLIEWSPRNRRAFYSSLQQSSVILGTLLGSGLAATLASGLAEDALASWGWRVPFLLGGLVIAPFGFYLRSKVEESPQFETAKVAAPSAAAGQASPWVLGLKTIGVSALWIVSYYVFLIYMPSFLPKHGHAPASAALWLSTAGLLAMLISIFVSSTISDRIGRKPLLIAAAAVFLVVAYPFFLVLVSDASLAALFLVLIVAGALVGVFAGICPAVMAEMFPTHLRTTGTSVGFGLATAIFGGFAPLISESLIGLTGSVLAPSYYVVGVAVLSLAAILTLRETAHEPLQ